MEEALLQQLNWILSSDPLIDEVGFVHPSQLASLHASSPIKHDEAPASAFWFAEHKLAISTEALAPIYDAAKSAFLATRNEYQLLLLESGDRVRHHSALSECASTKKDDLQGSAKKLLSFTRAVLVLNAGYKTAWDVRKQIFMNLSIAVPLEELQLSSLALSFNPKCEEAWAHRRWTIRSRIEFFGLEHIPEHLLQEESNLVAIMGDRSRMNYRAWRHCCWLVQWMSPPQVLHELQRWKRWAQLHVADNCCFHFRRCLFWRLLSKDEVKISWLEEVEWNKGLIKLYIGREALWVHQRFLFFLWIEYFKETEGLCSQGTSMPVKEEDKGQPFPEVEIAFANACIASCSDDATEDAQRQLVYASTFKLWVLLKCRESSMSCSALELWTEEVHEGLQLLQMKAAHQKNLWEGLLEKYYGKPVSWF